MMMQRNNANLLFLFLASACTTVEAFPSGAQTCPLGQAAPDFVHTSGAMTKTTLEEGGFSVMLDGELIVGETRMITLTGASPFRGFLIRLEGDGELEPIGPLSQDAIVCGDVPGVTHNSREDKTMIQTFVTPLSAGPMLLDVSVVESNNVNDGNVYSYSQLAFEATEEAVAAPVTDVPTMAPTTVAPTPGTEVAVPAPVTDVPTMAPTTVAPTDVPTMAPVAAVTAAPVVVVAGTTAVPTTLVINTTEVLPPVDMNMTEVPPTVDMNMTEVPTVTTNMTDTPTMAPITAAPTVMGTTAAPVVPSNMTEEEGRTVTPGVSGALSTGNSLLVATAVAVLAMIL